VARTAAAIRVLEVVGKRPRVGLGKADLTELVVSGGSSVQDGASSRGCDGRCQARTQGALVIVIDRRVSVRPRTPLGAVQRGSATQSLILNGTP
jgi:hypothetical protein